MVSINASQRLFVIPCGSGFTCLGFDVAFEQLKQYSAELNRPAPLESEKGSMKQYNELQAVTAALVATKPSKVFYDPNTDPEVIKVLERYKSSDSPIRLFFGCTETGRDALEEYDVRGLVRTTTGPIRRPILVANASSSGGGIISSNRIVRLMDVKSKSSLYMHPEYHAPLMEVEACSDTPGYEAQVLVLGKRHARFKTRANAINWVEFMRGNRMRAF